MVSELITLFTLLSEVLMILLCLHTAFGKKIRLDIRTIGVVVIFCLFFMMVNMYYIPHAYMVLVYVGLWIYCKIKFRLSLGKTIVQYIIGFSLAGLLELVVSCSIAGLGHRMDANVAALIAGLVSVALSFLINKFFCKYMISIRFSKSMICVIIFYILTFGTMVLDYYRNNINFNIYEIVIFSFLLIGYFYLYAIEQAKNTIDKKTMENELQGIYGNAYLELIKEVRRKQHDFKNQIGAILSTHLVANSLEELIEMQNQYTKQILVDNKYDSILTNCNNQILAGYIFSRCSTCDKKGIAVNCNIKIDRCSCSWGLHEIIELLGILLDNACENIILEKTIDKTINLIFLENEQEISISVANPAKVKDSTEIERMFSEGYSTKGENRGIGLSRVMELIQKYNNVLETKNYLVDNNNWIEFTIKICKK